MTEPRLRAPAPERMDALADELGCALSFEETGWPAQNVESAVKAARAAGGRATERLTAALVDPRPAALAAALHELMLAHLLSGRARAFRALRDGRPDLAARAVAVARDRRRRLGAELSDLLVPRRSAGRGAPSPMPEATVPFSPEAAALAALESAESAVVQAARAVDLSKGAIRTVSRTVEELATDPPR